MNDSLGRAIVLAAIIPAASFAVAIGLLWFLSPRISFDDPHSPRISTFFDDPFRLGQAYASGALTSVIASFLLNLLAIRLSLPGRGDGCVHPIPPGSSPRSSNKENRQGDKATGRGGEP